MDISEEPLQAESPSNGDNASSPKSPTPQHDFNIRTALDKALTFFSTASNETLGLCFLGLGASTYLILGRVGLVLIGAAGGVLLHATWEKSDGSEVAAENEQTRRREVGIDVARRVLEWRSARTQQASEQKHTERSLSLSKDFTDFPPEVSEALNILTDAVIRDYVRWWYSPILPSDEAFPAVSRATFSSFVHSLSKNVSRKRPADSFLEFVTNSSSIFIVLLNDLSAALFAAPSSPASDAIQAFLETKPDSNLANLVDEKEQTRKLLVIADDVLAAYLEPAVYACPPARVFLREIFANVVLGMTIERFSEADYINDWIVYLLKDAEPEILTAVDAGLGTSTEATSQGSSAIETGDAGTSPSANHKRTKSRAEEAMEEAMQEAQRLTQLIADEEARREKGQESPQLITGDDVSDSTNTHGIQTPTSSQEDLQGEQQAVQVESASASGELPTTASQESEDAPPSGFVNFDQLAAPSIPTALLDDSATSQRRQETMTLHNARVMIFDDAEPGDRKALRGKPTADYMIQLEPASSQVSGWMIGRTYTDFEILHEVLRRISNISGLGTFNEAHAQLPIWKGRTKAQLTQELERYLLDALSSEPLAESEGMKRFLEKERGMTSKSPAGGKGGFWAGPTAIENMGKGVFDVLSKAPKNVVGGVAGGGKAVLGGVTSVFGGGFGQQPSKSITSPTPSDPRQSISSPSRHASSIHSASPSASSYQASSAGPSVDSMCDPPIDTLARNQSRASSTQVRSRDSVDLGNRIASNPPTSPTPPSPETPPLQPQMNLPPPPSDMPDNYGRAQKASIQRTTSPTTTATPSEPPSSSISTPTPTLAPIISNPAIKTTTSKPPLTEPETRQTIDLLFATISTLYTLSSAFFLRRTLLTAARTYLLRPGNPQLESIRLLIQESMLDANCSPSGIADHILKLRYNCLPTEEELATWLRPRSGEEKEQLRIKARKLLVEKGMPAALTGVMGQAASGEALGRVFDSLQVKSVARGLMFGLVLQGVRGVCQ